jgi:acetyl esterase/lipase
LFSCQKDKEIKSFDEIKNIDYGSKPRNQLDLFIPRNHGKKLPLVIFVHGGGWIGGDKSQVNSFLMPFLNKGIAVASIEYSLADGQNTADQINSDIKNAVSFLTNQASTYNLSTDAIGMMGYSAGSQLALLYSFKNGNIKAVASISGLANLTHPYYTDTNHTIHTLISQYVGTSYLSSANAWLSNSPFYYVESYKIPTYLVSAKSDEIVSLEDAKRFHERLDSLFIKNVYKEYEGDHQLFFDLAASEWDKIADWFLIYLNK